MPEAIAGQIAGAAIGGLLGGDGGGSQQTASRDPWQPTQEWLKNLIAQGQQLQGYYQANPFNSIQQQAYGNIVNDGEGYRQTILPSLLGFANTLTSGQNSYDRRDPFKKPTGFNFPTNITPETTQANGNANYINGLYQSNFGKPADAQAMQFWQNDLANGVSREAIANELARQRGVKAPQPIGLLGDPNAATRQAFASQNPFQNGAIPQQAAPAMPQQMGGGRGWQTALPGLRGALPDEYFYGSTGA